MKRPDARLGKRPSRKNSRSRMSALENNGINQPGISWCRKKPPSPTGLNRSPGNRPGRRDNRKKQVGISQCGAMPPSPTRPSMSPRSRAGRRGNRLPPKPRNGKEPPGQHRLRRGTGGQCNRAAIILPAVARPLTRTTPPTRRTGSKIPTGMTTQTWKNRGTGQTGITVSTETPLGVENGSKPAPKTETNLDKKEATMIPANVRNIRRLFY